MDIQQHIDNVDASKRLGNLEAAIGDTLGLVDEIRLNHSSLLNSTVTFLKKSFQESLEHINKG